MKGKLVSNRKINILYFIRYVDNFYELCSKIFKGNIKRKDIIENEMKVFGNLNFSLYLIPLLKASILVNVFLDPDFSN